MNYSTDYLAHFGIKGMKWGIRRFMNEDGTLTEEGKRRYGYTDTGTGGNRKDSIRNRLFGSSNKNKSASDRVASLPQDAAESVSNSKKPKKVSQMTDQELRDRINRMQMEKQYKQLEAESSGKVKNNNQNVNQNTKSFADKHPLIKQIILDTATRTISDLASKQFQTLSDELLAKKRMERAKEKGMLNPDLAPFQQFTANRNRQYNNSKEMKAKAEEDIRKRIKDAEDKVRETSKTERQAAISKALSDAKIKYDAETERKVQSIFSELSAEIRNQRGASAKKASKFTLEKMRKKWYNS